MRRLAPDADEEMMEAGNATKLDADFEDGDAGEIVGMDDLGRRRQGGDRLGQCFAEVEAA